MGSDPYDTTVGVEASVVRSVACTGGVHAGTDTGVFGTARDVVVAPSVVVVDSELFDEQAEANTVKARSAIPASANFRPPVLRIVVPSQDISAVISASSSCFRTLPVALYGRASRKITCVGTL